MEHRPGRRDEPRPVNEVIRASSQFLGHGLAFAVSTLLFLLGGHWLDGRLGTDPVLAVVGTVVGASAGFYSLYAHVTAASRTTEEEGKADP